MNSSTVTRFFDAWSIYDLVLDRNYMYHNEIFHDVARMLREHFGRRSFSILDLGCGSARHLAAALRGLPVSRYVGCDLSAVALTHARENLRGLPGTVELRQANLLESLECADDPFDIVFSSFALHHLTTPDKELFFALANRGLTADGMILLIDTAAEEHEDRDSNLASYCQWITSDWSELPGEARQLIVDHILHSDYPEKGSTLHALAEKSGFPHRANVNQFGWHHTWRFQKEAAASPKDP